MVRAARLQEEFSDAFHVHSQIRPRWAADTGAHRGDEQARRPGDQGRPPARHGRADALATGAQVRITDGHLSVVDGPFVEAKEVIGGYAIFELPGKEEALASAREFISPNRVFGGEDTPTGRSIVFWHGRRSKGKIGTDRWFLSPRRHGIYLFERKNRRHGQDSRQRNGNLPD
jgi:YCII-related domain